MRALASVAVDRPRSAAGWLSLDRVGARARVAILVALLIVGALLDVARFDALPVGTYLDDADYIVTARGIATGAGFALISSPGNPAELKYPPGFPLFLAPFTLVAQDNLPVLRIPSILLSLASLPIWFVVLKRWLPFPVAATVLAAIGTNEVVVATSTIVLSENLFMILTALLFLAATSWLRPGRQLHIPHYLALAGLLVALYFTRSIGLVFCAALVLFLVLSGRRKDSIVLLALVLPPVVAWSVRTYLAAGGLLSAGYARELATSGRELLPTTTSVDRPVETNLLARTTGQVADTFHYYATIGIPGALSFFPEGRASGGGILSRLLHTDWIYGAVAVLLTAIVCFGLIVRGRRAQFPELAGALYLAALLAWPGVAIRLLHPIVPLLYLFLYEGLSVAWRRLRPRGSASWLLPSLPGALLGLLVVWNVFRDVQDTRTPVPNRTDFVVGTAWLSQNTPADSIVMSQWPVSRYLYAHRKMVYPPTLDTTDADRLKAIQAAGVDYVLLAPPWCCTRQLDTLALDQQQWMAARPDLFALVFFDQEHNVSVYQVLRRG